MISEYSISPAVNYTMNVSPDFELAGTDLVSELLVRDKEGYTRAVLPETYQYVNSNFTPNNKYTLFFVCSFDDFPTTLPKTYIEFLDTGGLSRRQLILTANGLIISETDSVGGVLTLGQNTQNSFTIPRKKRVIIVMTNTGNRSYLYLATEYGRMMEIDEAVHDNTKIINQFRFNGAINFYHALGYNSFIYDPTDIINELSTKYSLNTSVQSYTDEPTLSHCYAFSNANTVYDMIGNIDLAKTGTVIDVSHQFQGNNSRGAVEGGGYFTASSLPSSFLGDHSVAFRIRTNTTSARQCLFDCGAYRLGLSSSNQLEIESNGVVVTGDTLELDPGSENEQGWYQIFSHRTGERIYLFDEFNTGISLVSTNFNYSPPRWMNTLQANRQWNGRLNWSCIAPSRLTLAHKNFMSGHTAPNMGSITLQGRPIFKGK